MSINGFRVTTLAELFINSVFVIRSNNCNEAYRIIGYQHTLKRLFCAYSTILNAHMTLYGDHKCLFGRCSGYCLWYLQQAKYFTSSCSSSHCILLGSHLMMPFDYQHQAGEANARNWKAIIRYLDQPFSHFLENYVNADGKIVACL